MSTPSTPASTRCSCRLPWTVAAIVVLVGSVGVVLQSTRQPLLTTAAVTPANPMSKSASETSLADLRHELEETRRVLDDAHSALAQRDREISAAEDEVRVLRAELATLRARQAGTTTAP